MAWSLLRISYKQWLNMSMHAAGMANVVRDCDVAMAVSRQRSESEANGLFSPKGKTRRPSNFERTKKYGVHCNWKSRGDENDVGRKPEWMRSSICWWIYFRWSGSFWSHSILTSPSWSNGWRGFGSKGLKQSMAAKQWVHHVGTFKAFMLSSTPFLFVMQKHLTNFLLP